MYFPTTSKNRSSNSSMLCRWDVGLLVLVYIARPFNRPERDRLGAGTRRADRQGLRHEGTQNVV